MDLRKKNKQTAEASSLVTPSPTRLYNTERSQKIQNKRVFFEGSKENLGKKSKKKKEEPTENITVRVPLPLLPEDIWIADPYMKLAITDPDLVVFFGCCCTHANNIMTSAFAGTLSMETVYPMVAWMKKNLLSSVERWWRVHGNAEAGVQLGVLHGWYSHRPDTGLDILNDVIDKKNNPQAIYAANLLVRTKRCAAKPRKDMSIFFFRGTHADRVDKYYHNMSVMLNMLAIRKFRRRDDKLDGPRCVKHLQVPFWLLQCSSCVVDREAHDVSKPYFRYPVYKFQQLFDTSGYESNDTLSDGSDEI